MTFKSLVSTDVETVFLNTDDFAVEADYQVHSTGAVLSAIKTIPDFLQDPSSMEYGQAEAVTFMVSAAVVTPEIYDEITYNGVVYRVRSKRQGDVDGMWVIDAEAERKQKPGNIRG